MGYAQDRVQQHVQWSRSLTLQFLKSRGGRAGHGGLQGVPQGQGSTAFRGADFVDIPVPRGGGLHGLGSAASSSRSLGAGSGAFTGYFQTFPKIQKSSRLGPHSGSELGADFHPWTPAAYADSMALEEDELDTGSELESEPEEDADSLRRWVSAFAVCMRFLDRVPVVIGAPSHTHELSFTRKLQPMSANSPRTSLSDAVAASGLREEGAAGRGGGRRRRRSRFCRFSSELRRCPILGGTQAWGLAGAGGGLWLLQVGCRSSSHR